MMVVRSSAGVGDSNVEALYYLAIAAAHESIDLTAAYFVPRPAFTEALQDAAERGVRVRVLVPGANIDKPPVWVAGRASYDDAGRVRGRDLRVPADDAAREDDDGRRPLVGGRLGQLRQPLVPAQRRGDAVRQLGRVRPACSASSSSATSRSRSGSTRDRWRRRGAAAARRLRRSSSWRGASCERARARHAARGRRECTCDVAAGDRGALLLGHGAGGGVSARDLVAAARAARSEALAVALVEQPYRVAGRRSPAPATQLDAAWTAVAEQLRAGALRGLPLVTGGRSAGARVACRTAAATGAAGVLCLRVPAASPGPAGEVPPGGARRGRRAGAGRAGRERPVRHAGRRARPRDRRGAGEPLARRATSRPSGAAVREWLGVVLPGR